MSEICELCDSAAPDWTDDVSGSYHRRCVESSIARTTSDRARRGLTNTLRHGHAIGPTVKRATLWDGIVDTFATEGELNGWKPSQGALL